MRKRNKRILSAILCGCMVLGFTGCKGGEELQSNTSQNDASAGTKSADGEKTEITVGVWPNNDVALEAALDGFKEEYPDIEVKLQVTEAVPHHQALATALAAGTGAPDVALVEGSYIAQYRDSPAVANLKEEPYNAEQYKDEFVPLKWESVYSADGSRISAIPWDVGPTTMFYRTDVFEECGLPTEPEEVAEYMSTWDGVLEAARAVNIPGERWFVANGSYLYSLLFANRDFYDQNLELQLDRENDIECLEAIIKMREEKLDMNADQWSTEACAAYESGACATMTLGCWFGASLKNELDPDGSGHWAVTTLPGSLPSSNNGGSFFVIPEQSEKKEAAWAFVEYMLCNAETQNELAVAADYFPAYMPAYENTEIYEKEDEYYGGQKVMKLWSEIAKDMPSVYNTMMDATAGDTIYPSVNASIEKGMKPEEIKKQLQKDIEEATVELKNQQIQILKDAGAWEE